MKKFNFTHLNDVAVDTGPQAIYVFAVMRNEVKRLPYWLNYYRAQGISRFFVVDNGSTDGTAELLAQQPDCKAFQTLESYAGSRCGVDWFNALLDEYGTGHWCMVVDVDELFTYSPAFGRTLPEFVQTLEKAQAQGVFTLMIDMYPREALKDVNYQPGSPFWTRCNAFDARPYTAIPVKECPGVNVVGGIRQRLFYPEFTRRSLKDRIGWKLAHALKHIPALRDNPRIRNMAFTRPPVISKVPFVKWSTGMEYISGAHTITPVRLFAGRCALLHFKFFEDFHTKALEEIGRNQHYDGAREYRRYFDFLSRNPGYSFAGDVTASYTGPESLEALGLISTPASIATHPDPTAL